MRFLSSAKEDLQAGQHIIQGYISVWRILIFITGALVISMSQGIDIKSFFSPRFSERYQINKIPTGNVSQYHVFFKYNYFNVMSQEENSSAMQAASAIVFYVLAIQAVSALIMYQSCKYLSKLNRVRKDF